MTSQSAPSPRPADSTERKTNDPEAKEADIDESKDEPVVEAKQHVLLSIANDLFLLSHAEVALSASERQQIVANLQQQIAADEMTGFATHLESKRTDATTEPAYKYLTESGWKHDASQIASWEAKHVEALAAADAKIKEAAEIAGDTEVRDAMLARAQLYEKWGAKDKALEEYDATFAKTIGVASKLDILMAKLRLSLAFLDSKSTQADANLKQFKADLEKSKTLVEQGGDWERKNQLAVYEALYLMLTRQFRPASKLLLDAIATFNASELFDYTTFVLHTCVLALITVDRATLQKEILKSPEILSVIDDVPGLKSLLQSLYKCDYTEFFQALATLIPQIARSRYLGPHLRYYLAEVRVVAYQQFLSSYKSAKLEAMASAFGVSVEFIDRELFKFISQGRIHAKIDKVAQRVDTNRPDKRNQIYTELVKNGDVLLNRLQKLSKVIAL